MLFHVFHLALRGKKAGHYRYFNKEYMVKKLLSCPASIFAKGRSLAAPPSIFNIIKMKTLAYILIRSKIPALQLSRAFKQIAL